MLTTTTRNVHDLELFELLCLGRDSKDDIPPSDTAVYVDDSDDEEYDPTAPDHDDYF